MSPEPHSLPVAVMHHFIVFQLPNNIERKKNLLGNHKTSRVQSPVQYSTCFITVLSLISSGKGHISGWPPKM